MKTLLFLVTGFLFASQALPQATPLWIKDINAYPDSSAVLPVRTLNDASNNVLVLSTYNKGVAPNVKNKIHLNKYDAAGIPAFNMIFDNNGSGQPRGFDIAIDANGNSYIAGGLMGYATFKPFLMKVSPAGVVIWQRDSTVLFNTGYFKSLFLRNNKIYLAGNTGIAQFDINGNEIWSDTIPVTSVKIDADGQLIYSASNNFLATIFRTDSNGVQNFSDSSIAAKRLAIDDDNNFYLLTDTPQYTLVKYDSSGILSWSYNLFPVAPANGDPAMELICDASNDVLVIGLNDTMYKFSAAGILLWKRPMGGIDNYFLTAKITDNNLLAIAGSVQTINGYDMYVSWFDLTGIQNWAGVYSSNDSLTEYTQDMSIDNSGVYILENNDNRSTIVKFESPFATAVVDYTKICVDSVWYDNGNYNYYNVRLYNGNIANLSNPSVRMVSVFGDTTGNPFDQVSFPSHPGNSFHVYHDTITDPFITSFAGYTFIVEENFGDTLTIVPWCITSSINEIIDKEVVLFPNPVNDVVYLKTPFSLKNYTLKIYNCIGELSLEQVPEEGMVTQINVTSLPDGIYFVFISNGKANYRLKILKI